MKSKQILKTAAVLVGFVAGTAVAGELRVVVTNVSPGKGPVAGALYDSQQTFLAKARQSASAPSDKDVVELVFKDVPKGQYAVSVYQDLSGNHKLDSNSYGIPVEPYGMSRDARGAGGPPSFDDAKVDVGADGASVSIKLRK